ncbi:hypothetical protein QBC35DRAFT_484377 [Podospora australis]|uniref:Uncharacterized protein n=1 Tax=Podospora australis TaxID=1536484 RepID=A0AAN6X5Q5_9PEZI|nr:hypothetical protein QBC35DRAFT_484377 [Podospora australis]
MCRIEFKVYTVCAHSTGTLRECEKKQRSSTRWSLSAMLECRSPKKVVGYKFGFCRHCRDAFRSFEIENPRAILNYWGYKNNNGFSYALPASEIPVTQVFGPSAKIQINEKSPRYELIALGNLLKRQEPESEIEWLQKLEKIRRETLEWAEKPVWRAVESRSSRGERVSEETIPQPLRSVPLPQPPLTYVEVSTEHPLPANPAPVETPAPLRTEFSQQVDTVTPTQNSPTEVSPARRRPVFSTEIRIPPQVHTPSLERLCRLSPRVVDSTQTSFSIVCTDVNAGTPGNIKEDSKVGINSGLTSRWSYDSDDFLHSEQQPGEVEDGGDEFRQSTFSVTAEIDKTVKMVSSWEL